MIIAGVLPSAGSLVGLAAGDALGAGYEFGPPLNVIPVMKGGGPFGWEPGEWTDIADPTCALHQVRVGDQPVLAGLTYAAASSSALDLEHLVRAVLAPAQRRWRIPAGRGS